MAFARGSLTLSGPPTAEMLVAALPSAMIVVDAEGCIASVNAAAEMMLNASSSHLRHRPFAIALRLPEICIRGLREEAAFAVYDCVLDTNAGLRLRADFYAAPLVDYPKWRLVILTSSAAGQAAGQGRERREPSRSAIGAAEMLAHEIKNPLSGIRGAAQLLDRQVGPDGRGLTHLIREEVDRVAALIDRMEAFTDRRPQVRIAENIYPILEHARAVTLAGYGKVVDIVDAYDPSLPPILVNRDAMVQVLLNLLRNAAEAVLPGRRGLITLTTRYRHGVSVGAGSDRRSLPIELRISDDGPGPPPEIVDHLFEPFVSSKSSGRGLGLALVDKLVRDNGGMIQFVRDENPPRSTFRLLLPRAR